MSPESSALAATLRALHGESDVPIVAPALGTPWSACVLALAPGVDPVISALGALAGGLPSLLPPGMTDSPALHAAIASLIGTDAGARILPWWAEVAPAGWGATHAAALIDAVQRNRCASWAAAALIGSGDVSVALLHESWEIAIVIRRWGQTTPDDPTAWMNALTPAERDRLMGAICAARFAAIRCLPWLPEASAADIVDHIGSAHLSLALATYTAASPVARARHTDVLAALIQRIKPYDLAALTRLAAASHMEGAWDAVVRLLRAHPWSAVNVVVAAPWDNLRADVQETILSAAAPNDVCAAIAFARSGGDQPPVIDTKTACAFLAAVTPAVWSTLTKEMQRTWHNALNSTDRHLAVRSLGPDPAFLAHTRLNDDVIAAVRRSTRDDNDLRHTLLPIAVRDLPFAAFPIVAAALPVPPDSVTFVQITGHMPEMPLALHDWIAARPNVKAAVAAATALRVAGRSGDDNVAARCAALAEAFNGWSSEEAAVLLEALPDAIRAALSPHPDILTQRLARPKRQNSFRQALDALAALPPSAALPALHALSALAQAPNPAFRRQAGACLAQALRDHGHCFLALVNAVARGYRSALLPLPQTRTFAAALDMVAAASPLVAHNLAHALRDGGAAAALDALATTPLDEMPGIWRLLPEAFQQFVLSDCDALLTDVAAPGRADALAQALRGWNANDPLPLLALHMLRADDEARRAQGAALLAQQPDLAALLLPLLREDVRERLVCNLQIAVASADLPLRRSPSVPVRRRR